MTERMMDERADDLGRKLVDRKAMSDGEMLAVYDDWQRSRRVEVEQEAKIALLREALKDARRWVPDGSETDALIEAALDL